MATEHHSVLGTCPCCDTPLSDREVLIEYERAEGQVAVYAGCPECEVPVHPEGAE